MPKFDADELEITTAFEQGQLKSVASKAELAKFKAAARLAERRVAKQTRSPATKRRTPSGR